MNGPVEWAMLVLLKHGPTPERPADWAWLAQISADLSRFTSYSEAVGFLEGVGWDGARNDRERVASDLGLVDE